MIDISALTPPKVVLKGGKEDTSIKTKTILNNLKYETLLGDKDKLIKQLFAVEKNTKVGYRGEPKNIEEEFINTEFANLKNSMKGLLNTCFGQNSDIVKNFGEVANQLLNNTQQNFLIRLYK